MLGYRAVRRQHSNRFASEGLVQDSLLAFSQIVYTASVETCARPRFKRKFNIPNSRKD